MTTPKKAHCRYQVDRYGNRCTGEVVDSLGEIWLCTKHLGLAYELLKRVGLTFRAELATASKENA